MSFYTYTYWRIINGERSSAYVTVQVTSKGNIASVVVGDLDAFEGEALQQAKVYKNIDVDETVLNTMKKSPRT